jgi:hypothetical protein
MIQKGLQNIFDCRHSALTPKFFTERRGADVYSEEESSARGAELCNGLE